MHLHSVGALPAGTARSTNRLAVAMALSKTSGLAIGRGEATHFTVLGDWLADPLDFWITTNGLVEWIHADDLVVLVRRVLGHPVAVQHTQCLAATSNTFLFNKAIHTWLAFGISLEFGSVISCTLATFHLYLIPIGFLFTILE